MKGFSRPSGAQSCPHYPPLTFPLTGYTSRLLIDFPMEKQTLTNEHLSQFMPNMHSSFLQILILKQLKMEKGRSVNVKGTIPQGAIPVKPGTSKSKRKTSKFLSNIFRSSVFNSNQKLANHIKPFQFGLWVLFFPFSPSCDNKHKFLVLLTADLSVLLRPVWNL